MKSVIAQGASIAKAIEEALKKADQPKEFFVKLLEDAQPGFLGFGAKKAKVALFFKENVLLKKQDSLFEKGAYESLFNNQAMKKQIEQQLKELGLEIKPIDQKQPAPERPMSPRNASGKMEARPLQNKQVRPQQPAQPRNPQSSVVRDLTQRPQAQKPQVRVQQDEQRSGSERNDEPRTDAPRQNFRRRRYYGNRNRSNQQSGSPRGDFGSDSGNFSKDE